MSCCFKFPDKISGDFLTKYFHIREKNVPRQMLLGKIETHVVWDVRNETLNIVVVWISVFIQNYANLNQPFITWIWLKYSIQNRAKILLFAKSKLNCEIRIPRSNCLIHSVSYSMQIQMRHAFIMSFYIKQQHLNKRIENVNICRQHLWGKSV